ncbi:hypothetical protein SBA3_2150020 [Candidatus Sulfopaludibacter sp. SbA3]|nr:hypothetical protein SBA3_2150020 [Candidatus Sulfopaludibacter sp. SbA3]
MQKSSQYWMLMQDTSANVNRKESGMFAELCRTYEFCKTKVSVTPCFVHKPRYQVTIRSLF